MGETMDPISSIQSETHRRVLVLLARGKADQDSLAVRLSPDERAACGELHDWSPKDHVAHNNFWRQDAIARLQAALDGSEPPDTERDDAQTLMLVWGDWFGPTALVTGVALLAAPLVRRRPVSAPPSGRRVSA